MICPVLRLEYGIADLNDASTKPGFCGGIPDSPLQITYHRFLKLVYPDAGEAEKSGCFMLNELVGNCPGVFYIAYLY